MMTWHKRHQVMSCHATDISFYFTPAPSHPGHDLSWAELSKWQILLSLNVSRLWELCCRDGVLTLWQWWTDVTALLCLAVTLRHQPCHTQSHGKCHHTSHRVTHRFRSFAESFKNKHPCFLLFMLKFIYLYISDDIYKCKQLNETVHSKIHCRCIRYRIDTVHAKLLL